jgi:7-cyano-7-deazaguanine synthase
MTEPKKCVVLHSGGLDSTLCLLLARKHGRIPRSLGISYGQRQQIEIEFAAKQCARFGIERHLVDVGWQKPHIDVPTGRTMEQMRNGIAPTFLPGRNAVFLAIACAEAAGAGAEEVWIGVNAVDYSGYPDCRESFLTAFRKMWAEAVPNPPRVVAPLVNLTKPQIAAHAKELGLKPGDTWSCYAPDMSSGAAQPCGVCDACILHNHAWDDVATNNPGTPDIPALQ